MGATVSSLVTKYSTANAQLNNQLLSWIQSKGITGKRMAVASLCGAIPLMFAYLGMRITGKSRGKDFTKGAFDRSESRLDDEVASIASGKFPLQPWTPSLSGNGRMSRQVWASTNDASRGIYRQDIDGIFIA